MSSIIKPHSPYAALPESPSGLFTQRTPASPKESSSVSEIALKGIEQQKRLLLDTKRLELEKSLRCIEILKKCFPDVNLCKPAFELLCACPFIKDRLSEAFSKGTPYKHEAIEDVAEHYLHFMKIKSEDGISLLEQIEGNIKQLSENIFIQIRDLENHQIALAFSSLCKDPFSVKYCPPDYSLDVLGYELNCHLLDRINANLIEKKNIEQTVQLLMRLDKSSILHPLCYLIWEINGRDDRGDFEYGLHSLQSNPSQLLDIRNEQGENILEQIKIHLVKQKNYTLVNHLLNLIEAAIQKNNPEKAKVHLLQLATHSKKTYNQLCKNVWMRDQVSPQACSDPRYGENKMLQEPMTLSEGFITPLQRCKNMWRDLQPQDLITYVKQENSHRTQADRIAHLAKNVIGLRIAMVSAELRGIVSQGGLGEAVLGMASALQKEGNSIEIILPRYDDAILPEKIRKDLEKCEKSIIEDEAKKVHAVCTISLQSLNVHMIEDELFKVGIKDNGSAYSIYEDRENSNSPYGGGDRFIRFQHLAAVLCKKLYQNKKIDVVHLHDSQTALIPLLFKHSNLKPEHHIPTVFTFHNNGYSAQCKLQRPHNPNSYALLQKLGIRNEEINSFFQGVLHSDAITTVSAQFAHEAMFGKELERSLGHCVRSAAYQGRLFDVLNGIDASNWNPKTNATLKKWCCVDTLDAVDAIDPITIANQDFEGITDEEAMLLKERLLSEVSETVSLAKQQGKKVHIDLTYGKDDHPVYIALKKELCKGELKKYLHAFGLGEINLDEPLLLNIGRFDASQKGTDKIPLLMNLAKEHGAQLISIGLDGKTCPDMSEISRTAQKYDFQGAIVIQDEKVDGKIKWQVGHKTADGKEVPGFGPLLRAACDAGVFPSEFEPCGLVQGETFAMGGRAITTDTGGFHDTVFTEGNRRNGWRFNRASVWRSEEQEEEIKKLMPQAIAEIKESLYSEDREKRMAYYRQTKQIMENAELLDWSKKHPDDSMTATEKLKAVYVFAKFHPHKGSKRFTINM